MKSRKKVDTVRGVDEHTKILNQDNGKIKMETLAITFGILTQNTQEQQ